MVETLPLADIFEAPVPASPPVPTVESPFSSATDKRAQFQSIKKGKGKGEETLELGATPSPAKGELDSKKGSVEKEKTPDDFTEDEAGGG
jgi:hypothetical protein